MTNIIRKNIVHIANLYGAACHMFMSHEVFHTGVYFPNYFIHYLKNVQHNYKFIVQSWTSFVNNINMNEQYSLNLCRNLNFVAETIWILRLSNFWHIGSITKVEISTAENFRKLYETLNFR